MRGKGLLCGQRALMRASEGGGVLLIGQIGIA